MKTKLFLGMLFAASAMSVGTVSAKADELTWAGSGDSASWDTTNENWLNGDEPATWADGSDAIFDDGDVATEVTINEDITAKTVTVTGGEYSWIFSDTGSLTVTGESSSTSVSATINGSLSLAGGKTSFEKRVYIGYTADSSSATGSLEITDGTTTFGGIVRIGYRTSESTSEASGSLTISGGTVIFSSNVFAGYDEAKSGDGSSTGTITITGGDVTFSNQVRLGEGMSESNNGSGTGTMTIGSSDTTGEEPTVAFTGTIYIGYGDLGKGTLNIVSGTVTFTGTVNISDPGDNSTGGDGSIKISGGDTTFSGAVNLGPTNSSRIGENTNASIEITGGNVTFSGSLTISEGSTLTISGGTISLANSIANSGTVLFGDSGVLVLEGSLITSSEAETDESTGTHTSSQTYTFINGGNIVGWENLSTDNFVYSSGAGIATSDRTTIDLSVEGQVTITTVALDLIWNGTEENSTWVLGGENWKTIDGTTGEFFNADNVTFNASSYTNVAISEVIIAGSITVSGTDYTFTFSGAGSLVAETLTITDGATLTITGSGENVTIGSGTDSGRIYIGYDSTGALEIIDGVTTFNDIVSVGYSDSSATATGSLTISGGSTTFEDLVRIGTSYAGSQGSNATGSLTITDGTVTFDSLVRIGAGSSVNETGSGTGTLTISGGTVTFNDTLQIGYSDLGTGTLEITGGTVIFNGNVFVSLADPSTEYVGMRTVGSGTIKISGGDVTFNARVDVGYTSGTDVGAAQFEISDGTVAFKDDVYIGYTNSQNTESISQGTLTISGGTTTFEGANLYIGKSGDTGASSAIGTLEISGGDVTVSSTVYVGYNDSVYESDITHGELTITGGTTTFENEVYIGYDNRAGDVDGELTIAGGEVIFKDTLYIGYGEAGDGTLTLTGGEITLYETIENEGTIIISGDVVFVLDNLQSVTDSEGHITYTFITGTGTVEGWENLTLTTSNFEIDGAILTGRTQIEIGEAGQMTIVELADAADLVWAGTNSNNVWTETRDNKIWLNEGEDDYFYSYDNVTFDDTAANKAVVVAGEVTAGSVTVSGADYTFTIGDDSSLKANSLTIADTGSLKVDGSLAASEAEIAGSLEIAGGETTIDTITVDGSLSVSGTGSLTITDNLTSTGKVSIADSGSLSLTGGSATIADLASTNSGSLSVGSDASLSLTGTVDLSTAIANNGSVSISDTTIFVLNEDLITSSNTTDEVHSATYTFIVGSGTITNWHDLTYSNFTINGEAVTSARQIEFTDDGSIIYHDNAVAANLVWNGIDETGKNIWTDSTDTDTNQDWLNGERTDAFYDGDNVTFGESGTKTVLVDSSVTAGSITVSGSGYTFTGLGDSYSITADSLTVESTGSLTIAVAENGSGSLTAGEAEIAGSLDITGGSFTADSATVSGALSTAGATTISGTLAIEGGSLIVSDGSLRADSLTVSGEEGSATLTGGTATVGIVTVGENSSLTVGASLTATSADISGTATASGTMSVSDSLNVAGSLNLDGESASLTATSATVSGSLELTNGSVAIDSLAVSGSLSLTGGKTTIGNLTSTSVEGVSGSITVSSDATLSLTGTVDISTAIANDGSVSISDTTIFVLNDALIVSTTTTDEVNSTTYTFITGSGTIENWHDLTYSNFTINGDAITVARQIEFTDDGSIIYHDNAVAATLVWNGTEGNNVWTDSTDVDLNRDWLNGERADSFYDGDNVIFADVEGVTKTVVVDGVVPADTITVTGSGYTFTFNEDASLAANTLIVDGGSLTITEGTTKIGSDTDTGSVFIGYDEENRSTYNGGSLTIYGGSFTVAENLVVGAGGSLTIGKTENGTTPEVTIGGDLAILGATGTISSGSVEVAGVIEVTYGSSLTISGGTISVGDSSLPDLGGGSGRGYVLIGGEDDTTSSSLTITNGSLTVSGHMEAAYGSEFTISGGKVSVSDYVLVYGDENSGSSSLTISDGSLTIGDETESDLVGLLVQGGTLSVSGESTQVDVSGNMYVNTGASATIEGGSVSVSGSLFVGYDDEGNATIGSLTVSGGSLSANSLTIGGVVDGSAQTASSVTLSGGTTTIGSVDGTGGTVTVSEGSTLTISGTGSLSISGDLTSTGTITVGESGYLSLDGTIDLSSAIANEGTIKLGDEVTFVLDNLEGVTTDDGTLYTFITGTGTIDGWGSLTYEDFSLDGVDISARQIEFTETDGSIIYHEEAVVADLVWAGTEDNNVWVSGDDNTKDWLNGTRADAFYNGDNVTFANGDDISKEVTISGEIEAGAVTVTGEGYKFLFGTDSSLAADTLTVAGGSLTISGGEATVLGDVSVLEGASLSVSGTGSLKISGGLTSAGTLTIADSGKLELAGGETTIASVSVADSGTLSLTGGSTTLGDLTSTGSITVGKDGNLSLNGTVDISSTISNSGTITLGDSVVFILNDSLAADGTTYTFVTAGSTITDWSSLDYTHFVYADGTELERGHIVINLDTAGVVVLETVVGDLIWDGTSSDSTWVVDGTNWKTSDGYATVFYANDNVTFDDSATSKNVSIASALTAGSVTVSGTEYTFTFSDGASLSASSLTIEEGGSLTIAGGSATISGAVTISGGTLTTSADSTTFSTALTIDGGSLKINSDTTFSRAVTIDNGSITITDGSTTFSRGITIDNGSITITHGSTAFSNYVYLGNDGEGIIKITGGEVTFTSNLYVGHGTSDGSGSGYIIITGGHTTFGNTLYIGYANNGDTTGSVEISGVDTVVDFSGYVYVGEGGSGGAASGSIIITGGHTTFGNTLYIGYAYNGDTKGSVEISGADTVVDFSYRVYVGDVRSGSAYGSLSITDATVSFTGRLDIGYGNAGDATGDVVLTNASATFTGDVCVGYGNSSNTGTGSLTISGGEATFSNFYVGYANGTGIAKGTVDITDGAKVSISGTVYVGDNSSTGSGTGSFTISGNDTTVDFSGDVEIGYGKSATGKLTISGGYVTFSGRYIYVGYAASAGDGSGKLTISGGEVKVSSTVNIGYSYGNGTIELTGGDTTFSSVVYVGQGNYSTGELKIGSTDATGGTATFSGAVYVGYGNNSTASLTISGGTTTFSSSLEIGHGSSSTASFTMTGGEVILTDAGTISNAGTITLSGGTLDLSSAISNSGTVAIDTNSENTLVFVMNDSLIDDSYTDGGVLYTFITSTNGGSITGWHGLNYTDFTINGEAIASARQLDFNTADGSIIYHEEAVAATLLWDGDTDSFWTDSTDTDGHQYWMNSGNLRTDAFYDGDSVIFAELRGVSKTVAVEGKVFAGTITVTGDGYSFTNTEESAAYTITADSLTISEDGSLTVTTKENGSGTLALGTASVSGTLEIVNGSAEIGTVVIDGSVSISGGTTHFGIVALQDGGTLTITGGDNEFEYAGISGENSKLTISGGETQMGTVTTSAVITEGATLEVTDGSLEILGEDGVSLEDGGSFIISGGTVSAAYSDMSVYDSTLTISGGDTTLYYVALEGESSFTISKANENEDTTVTLGDVVVYDGTFEITGGTVILTSDTLSEDNPYPDTNKGTLKVSGGEFKMSDGSLVAEGITVKSGSASISGGEATVLGAVSVLEGASLSVSGTGSLSISGDLTSTGSITVGKDGNLSLDGTIDLSSAIANEGTIKLGDEVSFVLDNLEGVATDGGVLYTFISGGTITGWDSLTYKDFSLEGVEISARQISFNTDDGSIIYNETAVAADLVWNGTEGDVWSDGTGTDSPKDWTNGTRADAFYDGDNVTFTDGDDITKEVTISGEIVAGTVSLTGSGYTFTFGEEASLAANTLIVDGGSLTITEGTTKIGSDTDTGSVFIGYDEETRSTYNGGSLTIYGGSFTVAENLLVGAGGSLTIGKTENGTTPVVTIGGDLAILGATGTISSGSVEVAGVIEVTYGSSLTISGGTISVAGYVLIGGEDDTTSSSLTITNGSLTVSGHMEAAYGSSLEISGGKVSVSDYVLVYGDEDSGSSSLTISDGSLTIGSSLPDSGGGSGRGSSTSDLVGLLVQGSTLSVSGDDTQVDVSGDIYVNAGGSATIEGGSTTVSDSLFVGYDEKGVASSGSLSITGGEVTVSNDEGTGLIIIGETGSSLTVSGGSLTTDMLGVGVGAEAKVSDEGSLIVSDFAEIDDDGTLTISGGEVFVGNYILVYGDEDVGSSTLEITGGTVTIGSETSTSDSVGLYVAGSTVAISGDETQLGITGDLEVAYGSELTISGGATEVAGTTYIFEGGSATIEDGEVSVTGDLLVGYDEDDVVTTGSLTVSGGSLSANSLTIGGEESSVKLTGGTTTITEAVAVASGSTLTIGDANTTYDESADALLTAASATVSGTLEVVAGTAEIGSLTSTGTISVSADANLSLTGTIDLSSAITNEGTITLGDSVSFVLNDALGTTTEDGTLYTFITGSGTIEGWDSLTYKDFIIDGEAVSSARQISFNTDDGSIIYNEEAVAADLVWDGSEDNNVWASNDDDVKNWTNGERSDSFYDGDNVTFTEDGYKEIEVSGEVIAGELTVEGEGYTFSGTEEGTEYSVSADTLTIESTGSLTVDSDGSLTAGEADIAGSLEIAGSLTAGSADISGSLEIGEGGSLTVTDTTAVSGELSIAGDATLSEVEVTGSMEVSDGKTTADSLSVSKAEDSDEGGSVELTGGSTTVSTVTIGEDSTLTVGDANAEYNDEDVLLTAGSADVSGELEIAGGSAEIETVTVESTGTLTVDGGSLTITSEDATTITGSLSVSDGSLSASGLTLAEDSETTISGGTTTIDDSVTVASGSSLSISDDGSLSADSIDVSGSLTMSGGSLTASSATISSTTAEISGGEVTITTDDGDGTLTVSGSLTVSGGSLTADSATVSGSLAISGEGTSVSITDLTSTSTETGAISVGSGANLSLGGTIDLSTAISNSGTITLGDDVVFVLNDALITDTDGTTYTFITSGGTIDDWSSLDYQHFVYSDGSELSHGHVTINLDTSGTVVITTVHEDHLTWTGVGSNAWTNGNNVKDWVDHYNEYDVFYNGDSVIFADTYEVVKDDGSGETETVAVATKDVSIGEEIIANIVTVTGSGYAFTFSGDDASLTANSLTLTSVDGSEASLTLKGSGSITLEEVDVDAIKPYADVDETRLTINEGTTLTVQDDIDLTVDGKADVAGTLNIAGGTTTATSIGVAETGELAMTGGTLNADSLTIEDDATASFVGGNLNVGEITASTLSFGDGLTVGIYGDDVTSLTIDSAITLAGSVTFDAEEDETITLSGKLDGDGKLVKDGAGTLIVSGEENAYTGGTTVSSGTLEATSMSALGTGAVAIDSGATLELSASGEFTNATSGSGTLNIANGAEVSFGADIGVKNVSVASGATLSGGATLTSSGATLDLAGTLSLDLAAGETITFSSNGKMTIESTASLSLSNTGSLGDGSSFTLVDGGTVSGDIKSFLKTDSTLSGLSDSYAIVYDDSKGLSVNIMKSGQQSLPSMRLHDGIGSDFVAAVISSSDLVLDSGIQSTTEVSSNPIARAILNGKTSEAAKMLNTLAPDDYAAMIAMPTTSFHNDVNAIDNHLAAVRRTEFDENNRWGYFAQAQGTFVDNDDARDTQTFDFNLYGILAGVDYRMSNTLIVGATLGYDRGKADIHHSGGKIESDDIRLTAYASVQLNDLVYANVGTQLGVGYYDAKRKTALGHADGDTSGFNAGVFADVGMDLTLSENLGLSARPYVGISFVHSIVSDFNDDLFEVGSFNGESLRTRIGCGLFWDVALGEMPSSIGLDVSYAHDFRGKEVDIDATYKATGRSFGVTAQTMTEDFFTLGPVISIGISDGVSAFAGYGLDIGTDSSIGQNVYIGVRASF